MISIILNLSILFFLFIFNKSINNNLLFHLIIIFSLNFILITSLYDTTLSIVCIEPLYFIFLYGFFINVNTLLIKYLDRIIYIIVYFYLYIIISLLIKGYKLTKPYNQPQVKKKNRILLSMIKIEKAFYKLRFISMFLYYFILIVLTILIFGQVYYNYNANSITYNNIDGIYYSSNSNNVNSTYTKLNRLQQEIENVNNSAYPYNIKKLEKFHLNQDIRKLHTYKTDYLLADFSDSIYFSTVTYFTIGYGDIVPLGKNIKYFIQIEMILAHILSTLIIPILFIFLQSNKEAKGKTTSPTKSKKICFE